MKAISCSGISALFREEKWLRRILLFICGTIIFASGRGGLWFDEIWSFSFADTAGSPFEIFTRFSHDNNHFLNTLYLYYLGEQKIFWLYRIPSMLSGVGSVMLVGRIAGRWGRAEQFFAMVAVGFSFPMVLYFSEARGYGPAVFFSLLGYWLITSSDKPALRIVPVFWVCMTTALMWHPTAVIVLPAYLVVTAIQEAGQKKRYSVKIARILLIYSVPMAVSVMLYLLHIRRMNVGGGPRYSIQQTATRVLSIIAGMPLSPVWGLIAAILMILCLCIATLRLSRGKHPDSLIFVIVCISGAAVILVTPESDYTYIRYFLVCFPFIYMAMALTLGFLFHWRNGRYRIVAVVVAGVFVAGHMPRVGTLIIHGRGNTGEAFLQIARRTREKDIMLGSDHDFRGEMVAVFYSRALNLKDRNFCYVRRPDWSICPPEWLIVHRRDRIAKPPRSIDVPVAGRYLLEGVYPAAELSGWTMAVYHGRR